MGNDNDSQQFDAFVKIVLDGDKGVGKSSLIKKCLEGTNYNIQKPGRHSSYKNYSLFQNIRGKTIKIYFLDCHTYPERGNIVPSLSEMTDIFVFVYDISNKSTFVYTKTYFKNNYKALSEKNNSIMILVGNKSDLPNRKVEKEEAENYAKENGMIFIETNIVNGDGISQFHDLIMESITKRVSDDFNPTPKNNIIQNQTDNISTNNNNEFKVRIENLEKEIKNLKNINEYLEKELNLEKEKNSNTSTNESESSKIIKLYDEISENQKEIKDLKDKLSKSPYILSENEKLMSVIFYAEEKIFYSVICKNTDKFLRIEEEFYEKYPNLRSENNIFYANNTKIKKYETLSDNNIKNSDIIILTKA